mmetsp:Transcript_126743/g.236888  ORF Transcript_126743/g.236888 Transcript_126743/m.236888 type:complete len:205 (+) Transcript_126743:1649-2263(+)
MSSVCSLSTCCVCCSHLSNRSVSTSGLISNPLRGDMGALLLRTASMSIGELTVMGPALRTGVPFLGVGVVERLSVTVREDTSKTLASGTGVRPLESGAGVRPLGVTIGAPLSMGSGGTTGFDSLTLITDARDISNALLALGIGSCFASKGLLSIPSFFASSDSRLLGDSRDTDWDGTLLGLLGLLAMFSFLASKPESKSAKPFI